MESAWAVTGSRPGCCHTERSHTLHISLKISSLHLKAGLFVDIITLNRLVLFVRRLFPMCFQGIQVGEGYLCMRPPDDVMLTIISSSLTRFWSPGTVFFSALAESEKSRHF